MKFIEFGPSKNHAGKTPSDIPMITVSRIGQIVLNPKASELMKLKNGDMIYLCQDESNKKQWAIKKTISGGFTFRSQKGKPHLMFSNKQITEKILMSHNTSKSERLMIGDLIEGGYYPIKN